MADSILAQIAAAQSAPADDYLVWAQLGSGDATSEVILHSVRLPQSIPVDSVGAKIKSQATATLSGIGYSKQEIDQAELHISALPSAMEVEAELQSHVAKGEELVLADLVFWEACRLRLHLTVNNPDGDPEMEYEGLKIRRSAAS